MVNIILSEERFSKSIFNKFCQKNKLIFPDNLVLFLTEFNDSELEPNSVLGYEECCVRYFYGTTSENYSNIEDVFECFKGRMPSNCIPIAEAEGGNLICISLAASTYGRIYFWDHETMDVDEEKECNYFVENMPLLAVDFQNFLDKIIVA